MVVIVSQTTANTVYIFAIWLFACFVFFVAAYIRTRARAKELKHKRRELELFAYRKKLAMRQHEDAVRRFVEWSRTHRGADPTTSPEAKEMAKKCAEAYRALMDDKELEKM